MEETPPDDRLIIFEKKKSVCVVVGEGSGGTSVCDGLITMWTMKRMGLCETWMRELSAVNPSIDPSIPSVREK